MRQVVRKLGEAVAAGRELVVCSVVRTWGSTPQKAGAWMLVFGDGSQYGTLGGGCVEAEVRRQALSCLAAGSRQLLCFQLDDDYGWDDGLICGGRMQVLLDPVRTEESPEGCFYFESLKDLIERGGGGAEVVVLDADGGSGVSAGCRALFASDGRLLAIRGADRPPPAAQELVRSFAHRPRPAWRNGLAFLPILTRYRLVLVGAGHIGQAVAQLAGQVDFDLWVIDDRDRYANRQRFPNAERIIVGDMERVLAELETDQRTFCVIVTRGHRHDELALYHLIGKPTGYLGMIGSKRKVRLIFEDLVAAGVEPDALKRVHAPIGLDIGSRSVPEIAVSIVAELIRQRNCGSGQQAEQATAAQGAAGPGK